MLSRLSLLLPWLLLAGSWLPLTHSRSSTLGPSNDHVHIVYRVDQRSPRQIRYAGGFSPRGVDGNGFLRPPPDTSLFNHVRGEGWMSRNNSGYVSTTSSLGVALHILRESGTVPGYIYHIHVTPNFINVARTLGDYYEHQGELEFAALGGILWTQVLAWQRIEEAAGTPNGYHVSERVLNPDYHSQLFDWASDGGAQFQLAGFPDDHVVLRQRLDPWCRDGRQKKRAVMRKRAPIRCPMAQESPKALATKYMASIMQVGKLYVYARVSPNSWAGTTDSVFVMVGNSKPTLLFKNPYPGKAVGVSINIERSFGTEDVFISNLTSISLLVQPLLHPIASDKFRIESLWLVANSSTFGTEYEMSKFMILRRELGTQESTVTKVWGADVYPEDWVPAPPVEEDR